MAAGVHPARSIPRFAPETFRAWFSRRPAQAESPNKVLLWVDTFNDHFHPETSRAAVKVLEHLGYQVIIPSKRVCCGRPLYDFGMLDLARRYLEETLACLKPQVDAGVPMVALEPSCCSVFRDELTEMMPNRNEAKNLRRQTFTLSEFLAENVERSRIPRMKRKAIVQEHCHHHAIMRFEAERTVLDAMGIDYEVLKSGCCGMAGSFGFEKDKYDVSMACGERVLLPEVRKAAPGTLVLADGFSCKTQIAQATPREALHLAEAMALALEGGEDGPTDAPFVESSHLRAARGIDRSSTRRAAAWLSLALVLAVLAVVFAVTMERRPIRPSPAVVSPAAVGHNEGVTNREP